MNFNVVKVNRLFAIQLVQRLVTASPSRAAARFLLASLDAQPTELDNLSAPDAIGTARVT
jgi:hypothetical protein